MSRELTPKEEQEDVKKLTLNDLPKKLKKIAIGYIEAEGKKSLRELCKELDVKYDSVEKAIYRSKQKGKNFWELINGITFEKLQNNVHRVDMKTLEEGLNGTHRDRELFYKRVGILKKENHVRVDHLISVSMPQSRKDTRKSQKEIESYTVEILDSTSGQED